MKLTTNLAPIGVALSMGLTGCSGGAGDSAPEASEDVAAAPMSSVRDVTAAEAGDLIAQDSSLIVLDVRTPEEFAAGHVDGAINLNVMSEDFTEQLAQLDPAKTYVLHCKSGGRSAKALEVLKGQNFESIVHMTDGFDGWAAAGLEVSQEASK